MKINQLLLVLLAGIVLVMVGCINKTERYINSLESVVKEVETNGKNFTSEDWKNIHQKYKTTTELISEMSDQLTPEQNKMVGCLHARYYKAVVKNKIYSVSDYMNAVGDQLIGFGEELFGDDVE